MKYQRWRAGCALFTMAVAGHACSGRVASGPTSAGDERSGADDGELPDELLEEPGDSELPVPPLMTDSEACAGAVVRPEVPTARRLTHRELANTVRDTLGVDIQETLAPLPQDTREAGFKNLSIALTVGFELAEGYTKVAEAAVSGIADWEGLIGRHAACRELQDACTESFVESLGLRMFRRPLATTQIENYQRLFDTAVAQGEGFAAGARLVLEAMAQAPHFLYRTERSEGDGPRALDDYEMASRLSYFLWGTSPDDALFASAADGALSSAGEVAGHVKRMIDDERFRHTLRTLFSQWLDVEGVASLRRDEALFPGFDEVRADMMAETEMFVEELLWVRAQPLSALLTADFTIASEKLAAFYGFEDPRPGIATYDLGGDDHRAGILTQGSLLSVHGISGDPSLVERGLFVYDEILCFDVFTAPPDVTAEPIEIKPGQTQRSASEDRAAQPACRGCHAIFDPLAFPFERYDGAGRYSETDRFDNPLRADGALEPPVVDETSRYGNAREFGALLAQSPRFTSCVTEKALQFAVGRVLGDADACLIDTLATETQRQGGTFVDLMTAIVMHPTFRAVAAE